MNLKDRYHKETLKIAVDMAWPAIVESFFVAFAGLIDSLMVSALGSYAVAAVNKCTLREQILFPFFISDIYKL